ncbi:hypothetical protein Tco_0607326, partial [Tanacetum coccineum]
MAEFKREKSLAMFMENLDTKPINAKKRKDQHNSNQRHVAPQANLVENDEIIADVVVEMNLVEDKAGWIMDSG